MRNEVKKKVLLISALAIAGIAMSFGYAAIAGEVNAPLTGERIEMRIQQLPDGTVVSLVPGMPPVKVQQGQNVIVANGIIAGGGLLQEPQLTEEQKENAINIAKKDSRFKKLLDEGYTIKEIKLMLGPPSQEIVEQTKGKPVIIEPVITGAQIYLEKGEIRYEVAVGFENEKVLLTNMTALFQSMKVIKFPPLTEEEKQRAIRIALNDSNIKQILGNNKYNVTNVTSATNMIMIGPYMEDNLSEPLIPGKHAELVIEIDGSETGKMTLQTTVDLENNRVVGWSQSGYVNIQTQPISTNYEEKSCLGSCHNSSILPKVQKHMEILKER